MRETPPQVQALCDIISVANVSSTHSSHDTKGQRGWGRTCVGHVGRFAFIQLFIPTYPPRHKEPPGLRLLRSFPPCAYSYLPPEKGSLLT